MGFPWFTLGETQGKEDTSMQSVLFSRKCQKMSTFRKKRTQEALLSTRRNNTQYWALHEEMVLCNAHG